MSRLLVYLSIFSLPGAEELGLLWLTFAYLAAVLAAPLLVVAMRPHTLVQAMPPHASEGVVYCCLLTAMLAANFIVGRYTGVPAEIWLARSVHLLAIPSIYFCFTLERMQAQRLFKDICVVGALEVALIFAAAIGYGGEDALRRATDIEGVIVYSVYLVCAAFYAIQRFTVTRSALWLAAYLLIAIAAALTGTRVLLVSVGVLLLTLRFSRSALVAGLAVAAMAIAIALAGDGLFSRFNLAEEDNVITIISKIEELQWLGSYFMAGPALGQGFGRAYQVSVAGSEYTYSHNIVMFYLGYAGLIGFALALYPLFRWMLLPGARILIVAVFIFYSSATTYTNIKHSLFMVVALLAATQPRRAPAATVPSRQLTGCTA